MIAIVSLGASQVVLEGTAEAIARTVHDHVLMALRGHQANATFSVTVPPMGETMKVPPRE